MGWWLIEIHGGSDLGENWSEVTPVQCESLEHAARLAAASKADETLIIEGRIVPSAEYADIHKAEFERLQAERQEKMRQDGEYQDRQTYERLRAKFERG